MERVERYRRPTRVLHWIHASAFLALVITGLVLFVPGLGILAQDSWTRLIHRIAAAIFIIIPVIYLVTNWKATWVSVKEGLTWGSDDIGWLRAAPLYYFLGDESAMPPQGHMNTGQKLWWLIVLVTGVVFVISGGLMWFGKVALPTGILNWSVFIHDVAFVMVVSMFFVHLYLSTLHPLMAGVFRSMVDGTVSAKYAKSHHTKWYQEIAKEAKE